MRLAVFSHKACWQSGTSPTGFATDGGFPAQMRALADLFDETTLVVPCSGAGGHAGETFLAGRNLRVAPLMPLQAKGWARRAAFPLWLLKNVPTILREFCRADAIHAAVPGDVGTVGLVLALAARKPLFVRYCNNWFATRTTAERLWKWSMERFAGGRNVMLATGGAAEPPSPRSPEVRWIFATSLEAREIEASAQLRNRLPGSSPRLILVGRQETGKGTGILIESLPEIARTFPDVTLEVLGDGTGLTEFRRTAQRVGVADRINFRGNVDRATVTRSLQCADLFCFPTASEGFPKAVLEALACGLPVLATKVSVLPMLIAEGAGLLLDEATPEAVASGVRRCLSDETAYREMSARALETARKYSLESWRDSIGELLAAGWGPLRRSAQAPSAGPSPTDPADRKAGTAEPSGSNGIAQARRGAAHAE